MDKSYKLTTKSLPALPRSERRRAALGGSVSYVPVGGSASITGGNAPTEGGHKHDNLPELSKIRKIDSDGYVWLRLYKENEETNLPVEVEEKVRAGHADEATEAEHAATADTAVTAHTLDADTPVQEWFISRLVDDIVKGLITFEQGIRLGAEYIQGQKGAAVDAAGNAEFESIKVRTAMHVQELVINRIQAMEGDQILTENDVIETVTQMSTTPRYKLTIRPKWDGYTTAFEIGDVVKGMFNNISNGGQGVIETSWMRVIGKSGNELTVQVYNDNQVPANKNYPPQSLMRIARWGNESNTARQDCFYISSTEGRIVRLKGVISPIITEANYGSVIGKMPEGFLDNQNLPIKQGVDYAYLRGVIVEDIIRCDYEGNPVESGLTAGNNLLKQTAFVGGKMDAWFVRNGGIVDGIDGQNAYGCTSPTNYHNLLSQYIEQGGSACLLEADTWYTLSFYIKGEGDFAVFVRPTTNDQSLWEEQAIVDRTIPVTINGATITIGNELGHVVFRGYSADEWQRMVYTFKTKSSIVAGDKHIRFQPDIQGTTVAICQPKLERGIVATPWQPNADDLKGDKGEQGVQGAAIRGAMSYNKLADDWVFQSGAEGEDFVDVVFLESNPNIYYKCIQGGRKNTIPMPSAIGSDAYWVMTSKWDIVATDLLLAEKATIDNLVVEQVETGSTTEIDGTIINEPKITIADGKMQVFGVDINTNTHFATPNIIIGIDEFGSAVIQFFDNAGNFLYDLGVRGLSEIISNLRFDIMYLRKVTWAIDQWGEMYATLGAVNTYYLAVIPIGEVNSNENGKVFKESNVNSGYIDFGSYVSCNKNGVVIWQSDFIGSLEEPWVIETTYTNGVKTMQRKLYKSSLNLTPNQPK